MIMRSKLFHAVDRVTFFFRYKHLYRPEYFYFDRELLNLSKTLTSQSLLKHILTEGDKMMMAGFTTNADQGVYAFVVNYGMNINIGV